MKKSAVILLLVSLTAPFWGTYIFLQHNRNKIKKEIARMIFISVDKKDLIVLKFTRAEAETKLKWKHDSEFEYNGQMYDIIEKQLDSDTTWYYCFKDDKETRLNKEKYRLLARSMGQDPSQKSQTDKLTDFFKNVYRQDLFCWASNAPFSIIFHFSQFIFHYSSLSVSPPAPPPKFG